MSTQPTRFSQAQVLIAALFAVVLTGEMPESTLPMKGEIRTLEDEFGDLLIISARQVRARLARASILWISDEPWKSEGKCHLCRLLCRIPLMPSTVAQKVADALSERCNSHTPEEWLKLKVSLRLHKGVATSVACQFGVDPALVPKCWEMPEELDEAWHLCRAELQKIRAERGGVA